MSTSLTGVSLEQVATWLTEALQAKHELLTGTSIVRVNGPAAQIEFNRSSSADIEKLDAWIATLQSMLSTGSTAAPRSRPIYFGF